MIKLNLRCYNGHEFDTWFPDHQSYERQNDLQLVVCPHCGICEVDNLPASGS